MIDLLSGKTQQFPREIVIRKLITVRPIPSHTFISCIKAGNGPLYVEGNKERLMDNMYTQNDCQISNT